MKGYQISFITELNHRIDGKTPSEWFMRLAKELGVTGVTTFAGVEGIGADGRRHSARFFELVDQPVEIMMAVNEAQATALIERANEIEGCLFYIKTPIEYGELGTKAARSPQAPV